MLFRRLWTIAAIVVLAAAVMVAGCSDSDSPTDGGGETDTTPPGIAGVTAVDQNHVDVEFNEAVRRESAENPEYYQILEVAPTLALGSAPGDTIHVGSASLDEDGKTVHLTTFDGMQSAPYELEVFNVRDTAGNVVAGGTMQAFNGNSNPDVTAPTIVDRSPSPGQSNVGTGQAVEVQFSEAMDYASVVGAFSLTYGGGSVPFEVEEQGNARFVFSPLQSLMNSTTYTASIAGTAQDWAGNTVTPTSWNFTTTGTTDNTPPTLVSSSPADGATNVNVSSNIVLTFSEPVQTSNIEVFIAPDPGEGVPTWSNGDRTVTFDPDVDFMDDTQYTLIIIPGGVRDLAGNGNADAISIVFTTGGALESGGFAGVITGPNSADASGPGGATVIAADRNPFADGDDFGIGAASVVAANGSYTVGNLADGTWWPLAALDTNDDGVIDPGLGDAFGLYGLDFGSMTGEPDTVVVSGAIVGGINFPLYDAMAIVGTVNYTGSIYNDCCYQLFIGAFDVNGFNINDPGDPDYGTEALWPFEPMYSITEFEGGLADGSYYIGAYLDGNNNFQLDPGEPMNFYGGATPIAVTVANGSDAFDIDITLSDTPGAVSGSGWSRPEPASGDRSEMFRRVVELFRSAR